MHFRVLVLLSAVLSFPTYASSYTAFLLSEVERLQLHKERQWHALMYYQSLGDNRFQSEVDDSAYFLAAQGKADPAAELASFVSAVFSDEALADAHAQCRYPARFHWLVEALNIQADKLPKPACAELQQWFTKVNAAGATIVFPAAYLDSPSSMFGHTLLRLDQHNQDESNRILSYSVSYAAQKAEDDSELVFVYRGLVGGYPGDTTILPYYMKLKEYSDIESRDIWEYRLNLTQAQTDQLVRHIWEIKNVAIDYYFFTENCSYRVLAMLDAVLPEQRLTDNFDWYAIPIDTVRLPLARDLIGEISYRPSIMTRFKYQLRQLTESQQAIIYDLVMSQAVDLSVLDGLSQQEKNLLLDVAYDYSRMAKLPGRAAATTSYRLLRERQHTPGEGAKPMPMPAKRDDEGHLSSRVTVALGDREHDAFLEVRWRPAYHDLLDPALGYPLGSELSFFDISARIYEDEQIVLDEITLIGIKSLKDRNRFFKPMSWAVSVGASRIDGMSRKGRLGPFVKGQLGPGYRWGNALFYGLVGGEGRLNADFADDYDVRAVADLGLLLRESTGQWRFNYSYYDSVVYTSNAYEAVDFNKVFNMTSNVALDIKFSRQRHAESYLSESILGVHYYF